MRLYLGKFSAWPHVSVRLWWTLGLSLVAGLNLLLEAEIWPHTPLAGVFWAHVLWGTLVLAGPQVWLCGWHWLRTYEGPGLLRLGLTALYLGVSLIGLMFWLLLLLGSIIMLGW